MKMTDILLDKITPCVPEDDMRRVLFKLCFDNAEDSGNDINIQGFTTGVKGIIKSLQVLLQELDEQE